jgi:beta-lactamase regulating signal transducer with metallopeptidase domain
MPHSWALYLFCLWALIAGLGMLRIGLSICQLLRLRRSCRLLAPEDYPSGLRRALSELSSGRSVEVRICSRLHTPTAAGLVRPAVILPAWCLNEDELSGNELYQVMLHELTHLRRWDDWTNLAQKLIKALLFFNPAVLWIEPQISLAREMACDDAVVVRTQNQLGYARCLTRLAEKSYLRRSLALAQAAVSRVRQTSIRVFRILHLQGVPQVRMTRAALSGITAAGVVTLAVLSQVPEVITFRAPAPIVTSGAPVAHNIVPIPAVWSAANAMDSTNFRTDLPARARHQPVSLNRRFVQPRHSPPTVDPPATNRLLTPVALRWSPKQLVVVETNYFLVAPGVIAVQVQEWHVSLPVPAAINPAIERRTL